MFSAGIRPADGLAREAGLPLGERGGVLVNSCIRADEARRAAGDEYLQNKFREQMGYMQVIEQDLGPLVRSYIPLYKSEVHGLDALKQVARDMFAPADAALYIA